MTAYSLQILFAAALFGPLVAGAAALIGGKTRYANTVSQALFMLGAASGVISSIFSAIQFASGTWDPIRFSIPALSNSAFQLDGWTVFFLFLINFGVLLVSLFAAGYLPRYAKTYSLPILNAVTGIFIFGMQATVFSASVFAFLLFWEIMSVSAYFLVIADREEDSLKAGFLYFIMAHLGIACLLAGFLLLAKGDPAATFEGLAKNAAAMPKGTLGLAFFLLFAGFGSKAGLIPLHQWLPYAHPQAPSNSSALMSGVMLKVAAYGFLRLALDVFPIVPASWAVVVVGIGLLSAFFGVLYAAVETDLKRLLAWSSIENLGLIFAMIGTGLTIRSLGGLGTVFFVAAALHALNHTVFKSGLFMAAGAIISETHTRDLDQLGGLANKWPAFSGWFLGLVFAAAALPPLGTFSAEWLYLQSLAFGIGSGSPLASFLFIMAISVVALVGGLAILTFAKTFTAIFLSKPRSAHAEQAHPLPTMLILPVAATVITSALLGWFSAPIATTIAGFLLPSDRPITTFTLAVGPGATIQPVFLFALIALLALVTIAIRKWMDPRVRSTDTWDCGQSVNARMEYTATGFSAPIRFFFRSILLSQKEMRTERVTPDNAWILKRHLTWGTHSIWEEWAFKPIGKMLLFLAKWTKRLQNGVIQFYILLVLLTLITVLMIAV